MAKTFIDKCPRLGTTPKNPLLPRQKLGCKSPRVEADFWYKSPGVHGERMVMAKNGSCINSLNYLIEQLIAFFMTFKPYNRSN